MPQGLVELAISPQQITQSQVVETNCQSILFTNLGTATMQINGGTYTTGQTKGYSVEIGGILKGGIMVSFGSTGTTQVLVERITYAQ